MPIFTGTLATVEFHQTPEKLVDSNFRFAKCPQKEIKFEVNGTPSLYQYKLDPKKRFLPMWLTKNMGESHPAMPWQQYKQKYSSSLYNWIWLLTTYQKTMHYGSIPM